MYNSIKFSPFLLILGFCLIAIYGSAATIQPVASGYWNNNNTWPNGVQPTVNDDVVVPSGMTLTMLGTCRARNIMVAGTVRGINTQAGGVWIDLEAQGIMVQNGGLFEIGTETNPYFSNENNQGIRCNIKLTGSKIANPASTYKAIVVMAGGRLELHGKKKNSWTNLANTANAGTNVITLKESVNWEIGDKIALTSTELARQIGGVGTWEYVDEAEIASISADGKTITLVNALQYKHIGGSTSYTRATDGKTWDVDINGEVGLLSHYIKIEGKMDGNNESTGFGGHMMFMKGSTVHIEDIELYKMGQRSVLGRYPIHWHLNENAAQGSYVKNSSIHKSFNRAVTIHGTDYVTVDGVFAYDHIGHGFFFEDGGERYNTIKNNVVFVTRRPAPGQQLTPSDNQFNQAQNRTPSSYWITNPNNYFENNVAAGTEGTGFWFAFPANGPLFATGQLSYYSGIIPWQEPLGSFNGFVAHTCMTGFDVFDQLNDDHSIKANFGWSTNGPQYLDGGLFYGNDQAIYCGLGVLGTNENTVFRNCAFSDNKTVTMLAGNLTISNSLFNSDADLGVFTGDRNFFRFYDGPGQHINCHFEGWNRSYTNMIMPQIGGGATPNVNPTFIGTTKGWPEPFPFQFVNITPATRPAKVNQFFKDYDGGLLGKANTTLVRDHPFNTDGHEYKESSWVRATRSDYFFATIWLHRVTSSAAPLAVVRSKPGESDVCFWDVGTTNQTYKFGVIVNQGFTYTYHLTQIPASKNIHIIMDRGETGDLVMMNYKGMGRLQNFSVTGATARGSIAQVEAATNNSYFIAANGDTYLKMRATGPGRSTVDFNWSGNGTFQLTTPPCTSNTIPLATDSDGDGMSDDDENAACRLPQDAGDLSFDFDMSNESFTTSNIAATSTASPIYWLLRSEFTNDPFVIRSGLNFPGSEAQQINVRTKSEAAGAFQLFWATTIAPNFNQANSIILLPNQTNVFEELNFDLSQHAGWIGKTITGIRLDFPATTNGIAHTWVDYIQGPLASSTSCNQPPTLSFTSPTLTEFEEGHDLGVEVNAMDDGSVDNVQLFLNNVLVRQDNESPFEWGTASATFPDVSLLNLASGTYTLKAVVTDNTGLSTIATHDFDVIRSISLDIRVCLEGPMILSSQTMISFLQQLNLLPAGQPYNVAPWNYMGSEGQGWTSSDYPANAVDWVLVSFRTGLTKSTEVVSTAAVLLNDGSLMFPNPRALLASMGNSFYIVIQHRNHLGIISAAPISSVNDVLTHDFSLEDSYPFGSGQKELAPGLWAMFAGDGNQIDDPNGYDINGWDHADWSYENGGFDIYNIFDFNLDGDVNGIDKILWNINNGTHSSLEK